MQKLAIIDGVNKKEKFLKMLLAEKIKKEILDLISPKENIPD